MQRKIVLAVACMMAGIPNYSSAMSDDYVAHELRKLCGHIPIPHEQTIEALFEHDQQLPLWDKIYLISSLHSSFDKNEIHQRLPHETIQQLSLLPRRSVIASTTGTPDSRQEASLFGKIDHTLTEWGRVQLARLLVQRFDKVWSEHITESTRDLSHSPEISHEIRNLLSNISQNESVFLSLWNDRIPGRSNSVNVGLREMYQFIFIKAGEHKASRDILMTVQAVLDTLTPNTNFNAALAAATAIAAVAGGTMQGWDAAAAIAPTVGLIVPAAFGLYSRYGGNTEKKQQLRRGILQQLEAYTNFVQDYSSLFRVFVDLFPAIVSRFNLTPIADFQHQLARRVRNLIKQGESANLKSIADAWYEMNTHQDELIACYHAVGIMDVLQNNLYLLSQGHQSLSYCIAESVASQSSFIDATALWNPAQAGSAYTPNDLQLGAVNAQELPRTLVITGKPGFGKTNYLEAAQLALIMATNVGIAPALSFKHSFFNQSLAHLGRNVAHTDDALQKFIEVATQARADKEAVFAIFDEGNQQGTQEMRIKKIIKLLSMNENALTMVTTHMPGVRTLADENPQIFGHVGVTERFHVPALQPTTTLIQSIQTALEAQTPPTVHEATNQTQSAEPERAKTSQQAPLNSTALEEEGNAPQQNTTAGVLPTHSTQINDLHARATAIQGLLQPEPLRSE